MNRVPPECDGCTKTAEIACYARDPHSLVTLSLFCAECWDKNWARANKLSAKRVTACCDISAENSPPASSA